MNACLEEQIRALSASDFGRLLRGIKRGFEKECLRVDDHGQLAASAHPARLGSSLTHPRITTDYSEALLEFITPPTDSLDELFRVLTELHQYTHSVLQDELLWAGSMPCYLPVESQIPIAHYGHSNLGQLKHIYRKGLGYRYGRAMQTIAGVHYNFSLPASFWERYHHTLRSTDDIQQFISDQYLAIARNALRFGWLLPLLFGASPAVCDRFITHPINGVERWDAHTYGGSHATSLRLSDIGYHNNPNPLSEISYNSIFEFIQTMDKAVHTQVAHYTAMGVKQAGEYRQLNDCLLQIEDEHYALIRPKRVIGSEERMMRAIVERGIEYLEVRAIDLNPFLPLSVEPEMVYFLDTFLLTCLLLDSPPIMGAEREIIAHNRLQVVKWGRQAGLNLLVAKEHTIPLHTAAVQMLQTMRGVAVILDKAYDDFKFTKICERALDHLAHPDHLPSARVHLEMVARKESHIEFMQRWSKVHQRYFKANPLSVAVEAYYIRLANESIREQHVLERAQAVSFDDYLRNYLKIF